MNYLKKTKKIKGDASFRKFFRKDYKDFSSIIVYAKKDKFKNLLVYDAINKLLIKNKILAPNLYSEYYRKNFIEMEDFGTQSLFKILKNNKNKLFYFKKIIQVLNKIQRIKNKKIKNFNGKYYLVPKYSKRILFEEANLFCEWYVKRNLPKRNYIKFTNQFKKIVKKLVLKLKLKNDSFVHRDFHVSNLMMVNKKIGVIDNQDALIGNKAYDLASLIDDVRLKTSEKVKKKIFNLYIRNQKNLEKKNFKNDFEILSVLRNLKIIGIFTRLALRDNKKNYIRMIPHAWELINFRIHQNKELKNLKNLLNENFKKKQNEN